MKPYFMQRNSLIAIASAILIVALIAGCKKDESPTSPQSGNQSFTCKVDGKDWSANAPNSPVVAGYVGSNLTITASSTQGTTGEQMTLMLINVSAAGNFTLASAVGSSYAQFTRTVTTSSETFMTNASSTGTVQITALDKTAKQIAGTFSYTAKSVAGANTVSVTNGSFSVTYQ